MDVRGEHEIYCCGARVRISTKSVEVLTEPLVDYCPLHESLYGTREIDKESVRKSVEMKIAGYGFCCRDRAFNSGSVVAYGASEMMQVWLDKGLIDCAVVVCEGAGSVIATDGRLVQSIGARLTGIIKTSPVNETIEHIEKEGGIVLDKTSARVDQVEGVERAIELGFKRVAVTVAGFQSEAITEIREVETDLEADVLVFSVCNTCVNDAAIEHIANADIACASASRILRTKIGSKALMQLGMMIPVYSLTAKGKLLVLAYLAGFHDRLVIFRTNRLPYETERKGPLFKDQT